MSKSQKRLAGSWAGETMFLSFTQHFKQPPWALLPCELVQVVCSFLCPADHASASLACRAWRSGACLLVTHLALPLNHPLLLEGPQPGWAELAAQLSAGYARPGSPGQHGSTVQPQQQDANGSGGGTGEGGGGGRRNGGGGGGAAGTSGGFHPGCGWPGGGGPWPGLWAAGGLHGGGAVGSSSSGAAPWSTDAAAQGGGLAPAAQAAAGAAGVGVGPAAHHRPLPRLRTSFPRVCHLTLVHNALIHRHQVHAALATVHALWPGLRGLSVHDSVTWDVPLDYSALGRMTQIEALELLFQGQGGMDDAGQPLYRASMPHLCRLGRLGELCMKWIIGYDVDSFLDFNEVYDLLASLSHHRRLRRLQFGGENINAEGARHLASITTLESLHLVCDARPASPLHLLELLLLPRLVRLDLQHVCPDHAWSMPTAGGEEPIAELARRADDLSASPLRVLSLSLSPGCNALVCALLPLLPRLTSLAVRVTSSEEEDALCEAFRGMVAAAAGGVTGGPAAAVRAAIAASAAGGGAAAGQEAAAPPPPPPPQGGGAGTPAAALALASPLTGRAAAAAPPLRALRLETAELAPELVASVAALTALTSLQLPRALPSGDVVTYSAAMAAEAAAAAAAAGAEAPPGAALLGSKYGLEQLRHLGRLTCLRQLMLQLDSPNDTPPAFVDAGMASMLVSLPHLESLHLSTWNMLGAEPCRAALGEDYPLPPAPAAADSPLLTPVKRVASGCGAASAASTATAAGAAGGTGAGGAAEEGRQGAGAGAGSSGSGGEERKGGVAEGEGSRGSGEAQAMEVDGLRHGEGQGADRAGGSAAGHGPDGRKEAVTGDGAGPSGVAAGSEAAAGLHMEGPSHPAPADTAPGEGGSGAAAALAAPGAAPAAAQQAVPPDAGATGGAAAAGEAAPPVGPAAAAAGAGAGPGPAAPGGDAPAAAAAAAAAAPRPLTPCCLRPLPTWAWPRLRSLSLAHWPCVYGKLRDAGPPAPGRCYAVSWDLLPRTLEALLLTRVQLCGSRPPPGLRHLWLADCIAPDALADTWQGWRAAAAAGGYEQLPPDQPPVELAWVQVLRQVPQLETLVLRSPSSPSEEQQPEGEAEGRQGQQGNDTPLDRARSQLLDAVTSLTRLRTLGLGGIRCRDVPRLAPLASLRHLLLDPLQPPRPPPPDPGAAAAQRDLALLDALMLLPPGALAGLRTLWLPNWAMPIRQLLQWQQMLQAALPLVILRVTEYDVVWTVPTPLMHVTRLDPPASVYGYDVGGAAAASAGGDGSLHGEAAGRTAGTGGVRQVDRWDADEGDGHELEWWRIGCWTVQ